MVIILTGLEISVVAVGGGEAVVAGLLRPNSNTVLQLISDVCLGHGEKSFCVMNICCFGARHLS